MQKTQTKALSAFVSSQALQPIGNIFVLIAQNRAVAITRLADLKSSAGWRVPCNCVHGDLSPSTLSVDCFAIACPLPAAHKQYVWEGAMDGLSSFFQTPPSSKIFSDLLLRKFYFWSLLISGGITRSMHSIFKMRMIFSFSIAASTVGTLTT
jgi:hypothetical protein